MLRPNLPVSLPKPSVAIYPTLPIPVTSDAPVQRAEQPLSPISPVSPALPFPPLPEDWRFTVSRSNKYYFWQRGIRESTYKHPITGLEYSVRVPQRQQETQYTELSTEEVEVPAGTSYKRTSNGFRERPTEGEQPTADAAPGITRSLSAGLLLQGSRRAFIEKLNQDYQQQRISQEEYAARWNDIFHNIQDEKRQMLGSPSTPHHQPDTAAAAAAAAPPTPVKAYEPAEVWEEQLGTLFVPQGPKLIMAGTNLPYYAHQITDPAPHLAQGVNLPPPGPRINFSPPAPPQCAPLHDSPGVPELPPPQPPAPMTFLAPPLRNGQNMSPPEGEVVTRHSFDFVAKAWRRERIRVRLDKYPFQEGSLRSVFYMKDLTKPPGPAQDYVAKIAKHSDDNNSHYFQDCEMQALAGYIAELFVAMQIPKKCAYLEATVIECHDRVSPSGNKVLFAVEPLGRGTFIKFTNNYGWINPGAPRNTPQAFSHFSHYVSGGTMVVVDVQGVTDLNGVDFYTDPQIHTRSDQPSFGRADLREPGIRKFFETHECNSICHALGLPRPGGPAVKPSAIVPPPNSNLLVDLRNRRK
eukprot:GGOE01045443.1.p1 GENE.GGOE01045443.1~~GGOE01045443.1.p1  ORF type:complete len:579 (+),score=131.70 GGOE01045443.1:87-1823(+)